MSITLPEISESITVKCDHSKVGSIEYTFTGWEKLAKAEVEYILGDWAKTLRSNRKVDNAFNAQERGWKTDGKTPRDMTDDEISAHEFWLGEKMTVDVKAAFFSGSRSKDPVAKGKKIAAEIQKQPKRQRYQSLCVVCEENGIEPPAYEDWAAKQPD